MRLALIVLAIYCTGCSASVRPTVYPTLDSIRDVQMQQGMTRAQKEAELLRRYGVEVRRFGGRVADSEGKPSKWVLSEYFNTAGIYEAKRELESESSFMGPTALLFRLGPLLFLGGAFQDNVPLAVGGLISTVVGVGLYFELDYRTKKRAADKANKWLGNFLVEVE